MIICKFIIKLYILFFNYYSNRTNNIVQLVIILTNFKYCNTIFVV